MLNLNFYLASQSLLDPLPSSRPGPSSSGPSSSRPGGSGTSRSSTSSSTNASDLLKHINLEDPTIILNATYNKETQTDLDTSAPKRRQCSCEDIDFKKKYLELEAKYLKLKTVASQMNEETKKLLEENNRLGQRLYQFNQDLLN